jgi:hypothetical protein
MADGFLVFMANKVHKMLLKLWNQGEILAGQFT